MPKQYKLFRQKRSWAFIVFSPMFTVYWNMIVWKLCVINCVYMSICLLIPRGIEIYENHCFAEWDRRIVLLSCLLLLKLSYAFLLSENFWLTGTIPQRFYNRVSLWMQNLKTAFNSLWQQMFWDIFTIIWEQSYDNKNDDVDR